ncbi:MAG: hypothetical protein FGM58_02370 [Acidimicrobiia bacterium]|nr:hypothetical protein [Acidimicrobiia bacterium]
MLTTRMFTPAFKFFAGLCVFAVVAGIAVGITSGEGALVDRVLGPLSLGWKGGVGNHFAYAFFVGLAVASGFLAGILIAFRDADPAAQAQVVHTETVPVVPAPVGVNYLPALTALTTVFFLIGLATGTRWMTIAAVAVSVCIAFVWTLRTWAEHATGDAGANIGLYHRFIDPLRVPVISIVTVAIIAIGLSRVLLTVSKTASVWIFGLVALVFFLVCVLLALKPQVSRVLTTVLVILAAIAIIAAGIAAALAGERTIEHHSSEGAMAAVTSAPPIGAGA